MCVVWFNMVELTAHMVVQFDLNVIRVCDDFDSWSQVQLDCHLLVQIV